MPNPGTPRTSVDWSSVLGLAVGLGGIVGGLLLEGGNLSDITQLTGALIVLGGTFGAVMITTPGVVLIGALRQLKVVFFRPRQSFSAAVDEIIGLSNRARKNGIVALEEQLGDITDPFFRKAVVLAVDGTDVAQIRSVMEVEIALQAQKARWEAKAFEAAGGYAPTVGIIGAVLGLIQVMKNLGDIDKVGHGIAVAFVATVYGVASANLWFLPVAGKIKARSEEVVRMREMILEGVCGVVQGLHPKLIEQKLEAWAAHEQSVKVKAPTPIRESAAARHTA
jgi:chemotaxis protein MotA